MAVTHAVSGGHVWAESLCGGFAGVYLNVFECAPRCGGGMCGGVVAARRRGADGCQGFGARCVSGSAGGSA